MSLTEKFIFLDLPVMSGMNALYMHQRECIKGASSLMQVQILILT